MSNNTNNISAIMLALQNPIVDKNGRASFTFIQGMRDWNTRIGNTLTEFGQITDETELSGRDVSLLTLLQHITDVGFLDSLTSIAADVDTDHITDGTGNPLAGGKEAYALLIASAPSVGETIEFNGAAWVLAKIAQTLGAAAHQWLKSYDASTGQFTQSQPAFADLSGQINPATQQPASGVAAGAYSLASVTVDAAGRVTAAANGPAGLSVTITTAKLTTLGANGSMTFTNGVLTAQVQAT